MDIYVKMTSKLWWTCRRHQRYFWSTLSEKNGSNKNNY